MRRAKSWGSQGGPGPLWWGHQSGRNGLERGSHGYCQGCRGEKTDIGIMSDRFLGEVGKIPQKNLAAELLQQLIKDALKTSFKTNLMKQRRFSEMLGDIAEQMRQPSC